VKLLTQRRFGVEIECGFRHQGGRNTVSANLRKKGIKPLSVGHDGSGVEVRSPILKGQKGLDWLHECMDALLEMGCYVTDSDGMHVHHEGNPGYQKLVPLPVVKVHRKPDLPTPVRNARIRRKKVVSPLACVRLATSWNNNDKLIDKLVAPRRRNGMLHCCGKTWRQEDNLKGLEGGKVDAGGRMADLSMYHLGSTKGTIELRLHEGTLDFEEAEAWIRFGQAFLNKLAKEKSAIAPQESLEALLDYVLDEDEIKNRLLEKAKRKTPSANSGYKTHTQVNDLVSRQRGW
jgi:hypothetical protein